MSIANHAQFESWNGDSGHRWVARADERDDVLAPVAAALLGAARPSTGEHLLDIGCGCGATTLAAARRVGDAGSVTGVDLSGPMLDLARQRATGMQNVTFVQGDAQSIPFEPASIDLAISRFGTMFFADPEAAFSNIRTALRPGGRLCLATWQPLGANEWLVVPGAALLQHADLPGAGSGEPGMFAQSDSDLVTEVLQAAGFVDVALEPVEVTFHLGDLDHALEYLADSGPGRLLLETIAEGPDRDAALADVRGALVPHEHDGVVRLRGGIWLIVATRPDPPNEAARSCDPRAARQASDRHTTAEP